MPIARFGSKTGMMKKMRMTLAQNFANNLACDDNQQLTIRVSINELEYDLNSDILCHFLHNS